MLTFYNVPESLVICLLNFREFLTFPVKTKFNYITFHTLMCQNHIDHFHWRYSKHHLIHLSFCAYTLIWTTSRSYTIWGITWLVQLLRMRSGLDCLFQGHTKHFRHHLVDTTFAFFYFSNMQIIIYFIYVMTYIF